MKIRYSLKKQVEITDTHNIKAGDKIEFITEPSIWSSLLSEDCILTYFKNKKIELPVHGIIEDILDSSNCRGKALAIKISGDKSGKIYGGFLYNKDYSVHCKITRNL